MLLLDEDIRHSPLVGNFLQSGLDIISVGCSRPLAFPQSCYHTRLPRSKRTNLVQLDGTELGSEFIQQGLGSLAVRAVRLGEHHYT